MAKSPQGFIVVLPGEIIEIAQDDDISWLTLFYALPKELAAKRRILQKSENRLAELDRLFKRIYEDMVGGRLTEARFRMLADDYEQEQAELREKIDILEEEIQQQEDQTENVDKFIRQAKKYLHLEKLTPAVLNDLVKAVYVHAPDNSSGHRVQDVEISYNYIGILPATLLYDLKKRKNGMTEIMPFPENNYETVLLDRPEGRCFAKKERYDKKRIQTVYAEGPGMLYSGSAFQSGAISYGGSLGLCT